MKFSQHFSLTLLLIFLQTAYSSNPLSETNKNVDGVRTDHLTPKISSVAKKLKSKFKQFKTKFQPETLEESSIAPIINATDNTAKAKQSWLAVANAVAHSAVTASGNPVRHIPGSVGPKPTKYHYYPHNQHLYLLPECATQQVCSAVYLRLNYSQPLCACPTTHQPCSVSTRTDDRHTIPLVTGSQSQILTLVKTCERTNEIRDCRAPKDWSILALQNSRTGKAHYLVICRCPHPGYLEGPIAHNQPAYARVSGIRVYGLTCVTLKSKRAGKEFQFRNTEQDAHSDPFPWHKLKPLYDMVMDIV